MQKFVFQCFFWFLTVAGSVPASAQTGKIIEFGWDYPSVDELARHLPAMQEQPFDGVCFSLQRQIMEAFDTLVHPPAYFTREQLRNLAWGHLKSNFVILRGFGVRGGCWFDNDRWAVFRKNLEFLSDAMKPAQIRGVLFDPEYYYEDAAYNPWTFSAAQYPGKTFEEVCNQVRLRGRECIRALQSHKPDLEFLSIWLISLYIEDLKTGPPENTRHALLVPFMEGVLLGKGAGVRIIEGNEFGYWFNRPSQFYESKDRLKTAMEHAFRNPAARKLVKQVAISQPIFYDGLLALAPDFRKGISVPECWRWMEENTRHAIASSDEYTWLYTERVNWWKNQVNDTLVAIVKTARNLFQNAAQSGKSALEDKYLNMAASGLRFGTLNQRTGYFYQASRQHPMQIGARAFQLNSASDKQQWSVINCPMRTGNWHIWFNNRPVPFQLFNGTPRFSIPKRKKGVLVVLAKFENETEAVAVERL